MTCNHINKVANCIVCSPQYFCIAHKTYKYQCNRCGGSSSCLNQEHIDKNNGFKVQKSSCVYCQRGIGAIKQEKVRENKLFKHIEKYGFIREVHYRIGRDYKRGDFNLKLNHNNILIVENDEDGGRDSSHKGAQERRDFIRRSSPNSNIYFIHFNPDLYRSNGVKYNGDYEERIINLKSHINTAIRFGNRKQFPNESSNLYFNNFQ